MSNDRVLQLFLGNKAMYKVVKYFLHHPNISINVEEISKRTGLKNKESSLVIKNLKRAGFLLSIKKKNGKTKKK